MYVCMNVGLDKSLKMCHNTEKVQENFSLFFRHLSLINTVIVSGHFNDHIVSLETLVR